MFAAERKLFITADDDLEVYFDGVASEINNAAGRGDWGQTKTAVLPRGTRVIAVKVTNTGGAAGLVGSVTGDYLVTDESWVCSETAVDGWTSPDFDDSKWNKAVSQGFNDTVVHWGAACGKRPLISDKAKWIWNRDTQRDAPTVKGVLYFRVHLGRLMLLQFVTVLHSVSSHCIVSARPTHYRRTGVSQSIIKITYVWTNNFARCTRLARFILVMQSMSKLYALQTPSIRSLPLGARLVLWFRRWLCQLS